jgi:rod shape-determining protein MreC
LKFRSNLEYEYNRVVAENEQLSYQAMLADDLQKQLSLLENINEEMGANAAMNPIMCTVIGRTGDNYFSVFTINKGSNDGIQDYMAVTSNGALVGYTYEVTANRSSVRAIIDSQANVPGLIQSSRDQGMVRGTLGIDGQPMCRMYYLGSDQLPRPGDDVVTSGVELPFPKGIPIGKVRESTRGLDANKQYIVVEPKADFQHLEYVIVLRYQPNPEAVEARGNISAVPSYVPLDTPRPIPPLQVGDTLITFGSPSPSLGMEETPTPTPTPTPAPEPGEPTPQPGSSLEYQVPNIGEGESMTPPPDTPTPSPEPTPTFSLDQLTVEGD